MIGRRRARSGPPVGVGVGIGVVGIFAALATLLFSPAARATPAVVAPAALGLAKKDDGAARFVLIVGVNRSVDAELPLLRYADDDAARYDELFRALGGKTYLLTRLDENTRRISPEAVGVAREPRRAELTRALSLLAADVIAARARGQRTLFYFVYAGHGNVSGTTAYLALEDGRLDGEDIEREIVDKVHADESHLIIDACYSYFLAFGRGPGGSRHPVRRFASTEGLARRADVGLLLSTTSARESHEWEGFQAGIFSHEVRSGLYGAADLDGDGRISYREIAAFVGRANAAIPNERFRPDVFSHAPGPTAQLIDLRGATGRRLRVDATAQASHYLFEDTLGVRLADFHNGHGRALSLLLPSGTRSLYLRREGAGESQGPGEGEQEYAIPPAPDMVNLADLSPQPARAQTRGGPADDAFRLLFSLPFDDEALASYADHDPFDLELARDLELKRAAELPLPLPRWRKLAGRTVLGVALASTIGAIALTWSAHQLSLDAHSALTNKETAALNQRLADRRRWVAASYGLAGAAAVSGGLLLLWPRSHVQPLGTFDGSSGTLGFAGGF